MSKPRRFSDRYSLTANARVGADKLAANKMRSLPLENEDVKHRPY